jgi:Tfp pilus assembly protein PilE
MNRKTLDRNGYSAIELVLMGVVVIVLFTILASTFNSIRAHQRNNTRISDVKTIQQNLESFYARSGFYPTLAEMNNSVWTTANLKQVPSSDLEYPGSKTSQQDFTTTSSKNTFEYRVTTADGSLDCNNKTVPCGHYILSATLEGNGGNYSVNSLN